MFDLRMGDCVDVMRTMPDNSVDSIVTDPPYELGFMGKAWDASGIANSVEMWHEALRVLKPGGHLLAFSGSRTYHRMTCAIEDAGFEVRDQIMWVFGSGFPKSKNLDGQWKGWGTALKPAHEPICVARKPLIGTVAANVLAHGTGALNIDGCRVNSGPVEIHARTENITAASSMSGTSTGSSGTGEFVAGRWPANLIHDGSDEVVALFPGEAGAAAPVHKRNGDKFRNAFGAFAGNIDEAGSTFHADSGSAARFFYCAKTSKADRNAGTDQLPQKKGGMVSNTSGQHMTRRDECYEAPLTGNNHPAVKPTDLMAYLVRLVTPPGGLVLDPFMGSGSTGKACMREGFRFIGIDMTADYLPIAQARIAHELVRDLV